MADSGKGVDVPHLTVHKDFLQVANVAPRRGNGYEESVWLRGRIRSHVAVDSKVVVVG